MRRATVDQRAAATLAATLVVCLAVSGCGEPPPPPPPPAAAAPPPPKPISLDPIPELVVKAGTSGTARLEVNRAGHAGDAEVTIGQVSPELTVTTAPIAADSRTGSIVVTATETLGTSEQIIAVPITVTLDGMTAQENLNVKIPQFEFPTFEQQGNAIVQPGRTGTATFRVDRKGYAGRPIELSETLTDPATGQPVTTGTDGPREITCVSTTIPADADVAAIGFSVVPTAKDGPRKVVLSGSTMGRVFPAEFQVDVLASPYRLVTPPAVSLAAGETRTVSLTVDRKAYAGPIDVALRDLPEGVTADAVVIEAGADRAAVELVAAADAAPRVRAATLRTSGGPFGADEPLVVRITSPGQPMLPAIVTAGPEATRLMKNTSLAGRLTAESKAALADVFGGSAATQAAVVRGLDWLARSQQADGSWTLKGLSSQSPDEPAEEEPASNPVLATAVALLPFLGEGITHTRAPAVPPEFQTYKGVVERGLVALGRSQVRDKGKADGYFGGGLEAHALATQAFAETYALTRDDRVKFNVRQAVKLLAAAQNPDGSWGAEPGQPGDLPVTATVVRGLRAAQAAGLGVPGRILKKAEQFIASCVAAPGDASRYAASAGKPATPAATAAAVAARFDMGCDRDDPDVRAAAAFLMQNMPRGVADGIGPLTFQAFATDAFHDLGGDDGDAWYHAVRDRLVALQRQSGEAAGSWSPVGGDRAKDGGRTYATAAALLILQTPYRSLPVYVLPAKKQASAAEPDAAATDGVEEP